MLYLHHLFKTWLQDEYRYFGCVPASNTTSARHGIYPNKFDTNSHNTTITKFLEFARIIPVFQ